MSPRLFGTLFVPWFLPYDSTVIGTGLGPWRRRSSPAAIWLASSTSIDWCRYSGGSTTSAAAGTGRQPQTARRPILSVGVAHPVQPGGAVAPWPPTGEHAPQGATAARLSAGRA